MIEEARKRIRTVILGSFGPQIDHLINQRVDLTDDQKNDKKAISKRRLKFEVSKLERNGFILPDSYVSDFE